MKGGRHLLQAAALTFLVGIGPHGTADDVGLAARSLDFAAWRKRDAPSREPAIEAYAELHRRLAEGPRQERGWLLDATRSRLAFARQLAAGRTPEGTAIRDAGMAENLDALLDRVHPGRKVVVWAHNSHIARASEGGPRMMGHWVAERRAGEAFTIGLFMGRGVAARNDRKLYEVAAPPATTLEGILANAGWKASFVTLDSTAESSWHNARIATRQWGVTPVPIVPARSFDAAIYIDTVTPPAYR